MIPNAINLFFERLRILPNEDVVELINKESILTIPNFIDLLIDLAYKPDETRTLINDEAERILSIMVDSPASAILLKHLFELQGPQTDERVKTIKGNRIVKCLPQWKQNAFDKLIRRIMLQPNGVVAVVKTLVELLGDHRTNEAAFVIAKCICRPTGIVDKDSHYESLAGQISALVRISGLAQITNAAGGNTDIHKEYLRFGQCVALECVHLFAMVDGRYATEYLLEPLFRDFLRVLDSNSAGEWTQPEIVLDADGLLDALTRQSSLLQTFQPSRFVQRWLRRFSPLYMAICSTAVGPHKTVATAILVRLIELANNDSAQLVRALANLEPADAHTASCRLHRDLEMRAPLSDRQQLEIAVSCRSLAGRDDDDEQCVADALVDVLAALSTTALKDRVVGELFLWLMERRFNAAGDDDQAAPVDLLVNVDVGGVARRRMALNAVLCALCTRLEEHCFANTGDVLKLAQIAVNRYSRLLLLPPDVSTPRGISNQMIRENVDYGLNMINHVLHHGEISDGDRAILQQLFPTLTGLLAASPHDEAHVGLITGICGMIATRGLVKPSDAAPLIEDVTQATDPELAEALQAVDEPGIPDKAYGLAQLRELILRRNEAALCQRVKIYNIFSHYIFHSDSFVHLRAIRGLALLGDQFTEKLLPVIANKVNASRQSATVEEWLVLAEVLMQIVRNLGQMAPHYRNVVLNCIVPQLGDPEELVRASAVTNLGELCCQLEYAFSGVMHEVMTRVCDLLEHDTSSRVKVACAVMLRKLIVGQSDSTRGARPEILRLVSLVRLIRESLERVVLTETDPIVLDHVAVANQSLSESIRSVPLVLDPSQAEMKITIGSSDLSFRYRKLNF